MLKVKWFFSIRPVVQVPTFEVVTKKSLVFEGQIYAEMKTQLSQINYQLQGYDTEVKLFFSTRPISQVPTFEVVTEKSSVLKV